MAVQGGSGVSFGVIEQLRQARRQARFLELVHRLDRETSGILLVAKKRSALTRLQDQFDANFQAGGVASVSVGSDNEQETPVTARTIRVKAASLSKRK